MKNKLRAEKMNSLKCFSSYIVLCHLSLGLFSVDAYATTVTTPTTITNLAGTAGTSAAPGTVLSGTTMPGTASTGVAAPVIPATGVAAASPAVTGSVNPASGDQQFEQAQIAAQNLKALIAQQQASGVSTASNGATSSGLVSVSGVAAGTPGVVSAQTPGVRSGTVADVGSSSVSGTTVVTATSNSGVVTSGSPSVITAGASGVSELGLANNITSGVAANGVVGTPVSLNGAVVPGTISMVSGGTSPMMLPGMYPVNQAKLLDSGSIVAKGNNLDMSSYINSKVQDFVLEETIRGVLNAMEEMSDSPYNMRTIGSVVKALDNPSRARQEILMRSLMINQPNIVKVAVDKLISDYAPGNISEDQRNAVLSAARVAMEYGRQFGKLGALSFITRDLNDMGDKESKVLDAQGKPISKAEQDVGMTLTEVDTQTCMVDPQILGKLPAGCNIYTVNFYGQDGVNNFYKVNINGQMVSASNKALKVTGTVKWSITYGCARSSGVVAPVTPPPAIPGALAAATPTPSAVTTINNVATVGGFNCDPQKGLLLPNGSGISSFTNNNGILNVS